MESHAIRPGSPNHRTTHDRTDPLDDLRTDTNVGSFMKPKVDPYYSTPEWIELRIRVVQMNQSICAYCGCQGFQADHVIPRKKGGADAVSNLVCACARCNHLLGGQLFDSFTEKKQWLSTELKRLSAKRKRQTVAKPIPCSYKRISKIRGCPTMARPGSTLCPEHFALVASKKATVKRKRQ